MIEAKECAKMKPHLIGQYHRIESSVSVGFPDIVLSYNKDNILIEAKVIHGKRDPYFYLEKSQKIWHLRHLEAGCSAKFILFGPNYITILNGDVIVKGKMEWIPYKKKWKVSIAQFYYVETKFPKPIDWIIFNERLRSKE